ncbi:alpha/beta fold hydrolase [Amycolatopsis rifamycinica]|uniref:Alpha/beta hydrolase n=1 Tax=Amycolatopsis rifamycinica TaxID=287986 RepID=A0A066UCS7_9PSEU|nr:alpha/beta hydrolase [Amycolatopsis rifamycinica]KDN21959.1 alpha/beta hydrolase [Amycolatopsis rifamycinica]
MDIGTHTVELDGVLQRYHVHGRGPVCVVHPGGPGVDWAYLRLPALEPHLTMVYVEPIGTGGSGRLPSHPHGYTRERYARALLALLDHLGVATPYVLGHSHGGFVAQYFAQHQADRVAGVVLYGSAPVTGPEHGAEAQRNVAEFARRNAGRPELPEVLAALAATASLSDDDGMTAALRGLLPAYFADYWGREAEFGSLRETVRGTHISGLDTDLVPDTVDDRATLGALTVPALVIGGRYDVICGPRWAHELHELIPGSRLVVLEHSGHFGHLEEPGLFAESVVDFVTG